jgi:hypothetical protein
MPDGPVAATGSALKKVPKWAWIAGAGVTGGVIFYRVTHRGNVNDNADAGDATAPGDFGQTYSPLGTVTSTTPTLSGDYAGGLTPSAGGLQISDVTDLLGAVQAAQPRPPDPVNINDLLNSILPFMGGGAPQSPTTYEAPAAPQAAPVAPPPPAPKPAGPAPCPSKYPFRSDRGCYQVYCAPKGGSRAPGRWHNYQSGSDQFIHGLPC